MEVCTKKEIDLIIYLGQFQDGYGVVKGINYADALKNIKIAKSTFYKLLEGLEHKEIIEIDKINENPGFWSITILNNEFKDKADYAQGYMNLNYDILHCKEFFNLTKTEKVIIINLILKKGFYEYSMKFNYKTLANWTGKKIRTIKKSVRRIKEIFEPEFGNFVEVEELNCTFSINKYGAFIGRFKTEKATLVEHLISFIHKLTKTDICEEEVSETVSVLYKFKSSHTIIEILTQSINEVGKLASKHINFTSKKFALI
jgi:hypothetical protein